MAEVYKKYMEQGPTQMEIDRAEVSRNSVSTRKNNKKKLIPELKENYKRKGLCFKYRRKGHIARNCCSKSNEHSNKANVASASPKINKNEVVTDIKINREALLKIDRQTQKHQKTS
ncbi:19660_t:CDS:2 [Gigaspora margarita]|uniref:19660_t:CDS:1 n=1 Tax=Gigaspora margarita TaxID=4874 RepID=A0ABN7VA47_GIGMA|nr:19660_t:CDS:2 [Gigaspora margarita]